MIEVGKAIGHVVSPLVFNVTAAIVSLTVVLDTEIPIIDHD